MKCRRFDPNTLTFLGVAKKTLLYYIKAKGELSPTTSSRPRTELGLAELGIVTT